MVERRKQEEAAVAVEQGSFLEELYVARCKDTLEQPSREDFLRFSSRLKSRASGPVCSLRNQHLGVSSSNTLSKFLRNRPELVKLDIYCNVVRDQGLQVMSHLLQSNPSIRIFNCGCNDLTDRAAQYLAEVVEVGNLTSLQIGTIEKALHPNKFTHVTLAAISEALVKSNKLMALGMNGTVLSAKPSPNMLSVEDALIQMLARSDSLLMLRLGGCEIPSPVMMEVIEDGLCFNSTLKRLDVSGNNLSPAVGVRFAEYLLEQTHAIVVPEDAEDPDDEEEVVVTEDIPHVFYMDLSKNMFDSQVARSFANTLLTYPFLGYLDLSFNELGDDGAVALAKALEENQTLVELHLSSAKITSEGGIALAEALRHNQTLTTLNISKNKLGDETAYALAEALPENTSLTTLVIASAMLSNDGGIKLAEASPKCSALTSLDMSDNFFTESAGAAMEKLFRENPTILKIDVSGTQINHFAYHALDQICQRNATMLKQREQKPLRNQLVQSQYSVCELQRKEKILQTLIEEKNGLQEQIDQLDEQIKALKQDEEINANLLTKQIQEKQQQMVNDKEDFEEKMKKLQDEMKVFEEKKAEITATLQSQLVSIQETRAKSDEKKAELAKLTEEFEADKAERLKVIQEINAAADELLRLAQDPEALAALEQPPEFLVFEDDQKEPEPEVEPSPSTKRSRRKKKKSK